MSEQDPNQALQALAGMPKDTLLQAMRGHGELSQACLLRSHTKFEPHRLSQGLLLSFHPHQCRSSRTS